MATKTPTAASRSEDVYRPADTGGYFGAGPVTADNCLADYRQAAATRAQSAASEERPR